MKISSFIILLVSLTSTTAYSAWSKKCLEDCFSTHHECNYCSYQCEVDDYIPRTYTDTYTCPLEQYYKN